MWIGVTGVMIVWEDSCWCWNIIPQNKSWTTKNLTARLFSLVFIIVPWYTVQPENSLTGESSKENYKRSTCSRNFRGNLSHFKLLITNELRNVHDHILVDQRTYLNPCSPRFDSHWLDNNNFLSFASDRFPQCCKALLFSVFWGITFLGVASHHLSRCCEATCTPLYHIDASASQVVATRLSCSLYFWIPCGAFMIDEQHG